MGEILHTSRIKIVRVKGPARKAIIEGFDGVGSQGGLFRLPHEMSCSTKRDGVY